MVSNNPFADRSWRIPEPNLSKTNVALLVVDLQYANAHPDHGRLKKLLTDPGYTEALSYYLERLQNMVIPNTQRLLRAFRETGTEVIYIRIRSLTKNGRDRSMEHKNLKIHVPPDAREAEVLEAVAPEGDEIIIDKTCGSPFNGSNIDYVLRNIGVVNLVICGIVTSGCVEITARDAADRGYGVIVVRDAVATWTPEMESASLTHLGNSYAKIKMTDEVVSAIRALNLRTSAL